MTKKLIFLLTGLPLLALSCSKAPVPEGKESVLQIKTSIAATSDVASTKSAVVGTDFQDGNSYGLFVCLHGSTTERHRHNSWNIRARKTGDVWKYNYVDRISGAPSEDDYSQVSLTERKDLVSADVYAYAPYIQSAFSAGLEAIPFTSQDDVMWAEENGSATSNVSLSPTGSPSATFTFRHLCSLLAFEFKLRNPGSIYHVQSIEATLSPGAVTTKLYSGGTFNALTGKLNDGLTETNRIVAVNNSANLIGPELTPGVAYMVMVPTDVADDELTFSFTLSGQTLQPFVLKKEQVKHSDGVTYGFKAGYKYTFHFILDNYLYLDGVTISRDWTAAGGELGSEHI